MTKDKKKSSEAVSHPQRSRIGNGRRKHRHWEVTIVYHDGKKFARIYIDRARAEGFAERQRRSPVVRSAKVKEVHST